MGQDWLGLEWMGAVRETPSGVSVGDSLPAPMNRLNEARFGCGGAW